jgi:hypothetical protein
MSPLHAPNAFHSSGGVWSPCFGCWGRQQVPAGHPQHRPGRPRACRSPASKTENRPRSVPSRYSCGDVGRRVPDWQRRFWSGRIRIATYNLLPRSFRYLCAPTPSPEEKSGCKGKLQLRSALWAQLSELFPSTKVRLHEIDVRLTKFALSSLVSWRLKPKNGEREAGWLR